MSEGRGRDPTLTEGHWRAGAKRGRAGAGPGHKRATPSSPNPGVILARYGKAWREQRRFSVSTLRNLGLGKKSLEQWVTEEATYLCASFADQAGELLGIEKGDRNGESGKRRWRRPPICTVLSQETPSTPTPS